MACCSELTAITDVHGTASLVSDDLGHSTSYVDSQGNPWRPATEFCVRLGPYTDSVKETWWTEPRRMHIGNTDDPELYRYGVQAQEFWTNVTVGPGTYHVRLKFAETRWVGKLFQWKKKLFGVTIAINGEEKVLNSSYFKENTFVNRDDFGRIYLVFEWNEEGSQLSEQITTRLLGELLGIFEGDEPLRGEDGHSIAPKINAIIIDSGQIEGLSINDATELSNQLNAGRLPVPLEIIYEETVSPALGADFVDLSAKAGIIGIALVMLFMVLYYRLPGLVASLALIFYGVVILALFKLIPVTLTLAGIGGFVLSIGMAVDANILIFERMKEELQAGRTLGAATKAGFNRAWTAIRDSNITTFIVCLILIWVGSQIVAGAPIQGFGFTLLIGVALSMFTAIIVTRTLLRLFVGSSIAKRTELFSPYLGKKDV